MVLEAGVAVGFNPSWGEPRGYRHGEESSIEALRGMVNRACYAMVRGLASRKRSMLKDVSCGFVDCVLELAQA